MHVQAEAANVAAPCVGCRPNTRTGDAGTDLPLHRIVGLCATREAAECARSQILALGLKPDQVKLLEGVSAALGSDGASDSDDVLKDLLRGKGDVPRLIKDALAAGQVVLVIHALTEEQTTRAQRVVGGSTSRAAGASARSAEPSAPVVP